MSAPAFWQIADQRLGGVDALLLGDQPDDDYRVAVTVVVGANGPEAEAQVVYPCCVCGWAFSCHGGEDCHS